MHKSSDEQQAYGLPSILTPEPAIPAAFGAARAETPEQRLARAVIETAFDDLDKPKHADDARAFLAGGPLLVHWCGLIGVDPAVIQRGLALRPVAGVL